MSVSLADKSRASDGGGTQRSVCPLGSLLEQNLFPWFFKTGSHLVLRRSWLDPDSPVFLTINRSSKMDAQELFVPEMQFAPLKVETIVRGANFASHRVLNSP